MPPSRLPLLIVALLALPLASGLVPEPERAALEVRSDETAALPLGAPVPASATGIGPGSLVLTSLDGKTYACTANWVWTDGSALYLGAAGHCFLPEDKTATHGRDADFPASAPRVRVCVDRCEFGGQAGFVVAGTTVELGPVAYARQTRDGRDIGNDFGLVRIPDALKEHVRASLPVWGGANHAADMLPGDLVCLYGNGMLVGETYLTKARLGAALTSLGDGSWRAAVASAPGDSGAAVALCSATPVGTQAFAAAGLLTHLAGTGVAGTSMGKAQQLAREAGLSIEPVLS